MNNLKKVFHLFGVTLLAFCFIAYSPAAQAASFTAPEKLDDYLYYMEFNDYVPDLTTGEKVKTGFACSAVRNGNFYPHVP